MGQNSKNSKLIIVSNRLPIKVVKSDSTVEITFSTGGLAVGLSSISQRIPTVWIGWPGIALEEISWNERREIESKLAALNLYPVFLTHGDVEDYYHGFCNEVIWPLFHYFPSKVNYEYRFWEAYRRVNEVFLKAVLQVYRQGDIIWIHDYHLMLLPKLVRDELGDDVPIGFFLHIPFPSSELFRQLPWRNEILDGILGADLVGFHTYDYVRHFLSSVRRLLGLEHALGKIYVRNRVVKVDAFPMGIDYERLVKALSDPEVREILEKMRKAFKGRKILFSIDRLDYTKGIPERLEAYEEFLRRYPEYRGKVVFVLTVSPSRIGVEEYVELKKRIDKLVGEINGKYGELDWTPIVYMYRYIPLKELLALYQAADVAIITPLRDGMNIVAKEYVASKEGGAGVLILSECAGVASELVEALIVNPNNKVEVATTIKKALEMPEDLKKRRMSRMRERIRRYDVVKWARDFLDRLKEVKEEQNKLKAKIMSKELVDKLISDYLNSKDRIFFLDYDGTLVSFTDEPSRASPSKELKELLRELAEVPGNEVVIVSGRDKSTLDRWFGDLRIGMIAEHGVWIKDGKTWKTIEPLRSDWKREIRRLLELFVDRTPGSFIEEKEYSLAWHYRRVSAELGEIRAKELKEILTQLVVNYNLEVIEGDKVLEIRNAGINKGKAVLHWLRRKRRDFILAAGDDRTDEDMFSVLPPTAYTIKVGVAPSKAKYCVASAQDIRSLLRKLLDATKAGGRV